MVKFEYPHEFKDDNCFYVVYTEGGSADAGRNDYEDYEIELETETEVPGHCALEVCYYHSSGEVARPELDDNVCEKD